MLLRKTSKTMSTSPITDVSLVVPFLQSLPGLLSFWMMVSTIEDNAEEEREEGLHWPLLGHSMAIHCHWL